MNLENFSIKKIADGVHFSCYKDKRFQKNRIEVCFSDILDNKTASLNAIIPAVISRTNDKYRSMTAFNNKLSELYASGIHDFVEKSGDIQEFGLYSYSLCNEYAFDGENVLEEIAVMLRDCIFNPYLENGAFPESVIELQKQNLIDANDNEINNKGRYASIKAHAAAYKNEPASVRTVGENDDIKNIIAKSAYEHYKEILETKNIKIICIGPGDYSIVEQIFTEAFNKINRRPEKSPRTKKSEVKSEAISVTEAIDVEQSKLLLIYKSDYDIKKYYHITLASQILGGDVSSKLFSVVREKLSLCYYCSSGFSRSKQSITISSGVEKENLEKTVTAIKEQFSELQNGNFSDEDINKAKLYISNNLKSVTDCMDSIASWICGCIYDDEYIAPEEKIKRINSVTKEQIVEAAKSFKLDTTYILTSKEEENE